MLITINSKLMSGADGSEDLAYDIRGSSLWRVASSFDSKGTTFITNNLRQDRRYVFYRGRHYDTSR